MCAGFVRGRPKAQKSKRKVGGRRGAWGIPRRKGNRENGGRQRRQAVLFNLMPATMSMAHRRRRGTSSPWAVCLSEGPQLQRCKHSDSRAIRGAAATVRGFHQPDEAPIRWARSSAARRTVASPKATTFPHHISHHAEHHQHPHSQAAEARPSSSPIKRRSRL